MTKSERGGKKKDDLHALQETNSTESERNPDPLYTVKAKSKLPPLEVTVTIDTKKVKMEVDTGATYTPLCLRSNLTDCCPGGALDTSELRLCTYFKKPITAIGGCCVNVEYAGQIVKNISQCLWSKVRYGPTLFGRSWLKLIRLNWKAI